MICPNCYCDPCRCTNGYSRVDNGTTNYCPLCEQANRKIEKAIEILRGENRTQHVSGLLSIIVRALNVLKGE